MILVSNSKVPLLWNWRNNTIQPPSEHSQPCSPLESWQASAYCSMCHRSLKGSLKFIEGEKKVTGTRYYTTSWENLWLRRCWPSFGTAKGLLFERVNRQLLSCNHWFKLNWYKDIMKTWVKYNKREKNIYFHAIYILVSRLLAIPMILLIGEPLISTFFPSTFWVTRLRPNK